MIPFCVLYSVFRFVFCALTGLFDLPVLIQCTENGVACLRLCLFYVKYGQIEQNAYLEYIL